MGNWGSENFSYGFGVDLEAIVAEFPPKLKQAMYAAANHGVLKRGTWNNCAFNAADKVLKLGEAGTSSDGDGYVSSIKKAAEVFGIKETQVKHFIRVWDTRPGSDKECTEFLKETILKVGLFSEPGKSLPKIIKKRIYTSEETRMKEEFEALMESQEIHGEMVAMELLFSTEYNDLVTI